MQSLIRSILSQIYENLHLHTACAALQQDSLHLRQCPRANVFNYYNSSPDLNSDNASDFRAVISFTTYTVTIWRSVLRSAVGETLHAHFKSGRFPWDKWSDLSIVTVR